MIIRKIIHVDMDAFYASVEQRNNPELKGLPIAVGGSTRRGVIAAASYEARRYGVRSAMSSVEALRLCPKLIFVNANFEEYKNVSQQIRRIFHEFTDLVEPLSLDEAYLDVTHNKRDMPSATIIANEIRRKIFEETELTASAGISINKFLAKVASDYNKPNGFKLIKPENALEFIEKLEVRKFPYVGKVTAQKMYKLGIFLGKDIKKLSLEQLTAVFGKSGQYYYNVVRCLQDSPVKPNRTRKSIAYERTLGKDMYLRTVVEQELESILKGWIGRIEKLNLAGKTITLKIKTHDFEVISRSKTISNYTKSLQEVRPVVNELVQKLDLDQKIRLIGLSLSNLNNQKQEEVQQLTIDF